MRSSRLYLYSLLHFEYQHPLERLTVTFIGCVCSITLLA